VTRLGVRWTVGDVSPRGFAALRLSILGATRLFGAHAAYAVCVNTIAPAEARARTGDTPKSVRWIAADADLPSFLTPFLDAGLAEGVAWKLAPPRLFPDRHELSLDNDCIVWDLPSALEEWLADPDGRLLASDVIPALGRFATIVGPRALNTGMRGLPPGLDLGALLAETLAAHPGPLPTELDEQGLQVAALSRGPLHVVSLADVAICSPFPPHAADPGRCGAHFVGLNVHRERPYCDQETMAKIATFWDARIAEMEHKASTGPGA
jgi:hypothetical protein